MCDAGNHAEGSPVWALPTNAEWKGEVLPLEPVDEALRRGSPSTRPGAAAVGSPTR